jgi:hypothetical protein
VHLVGFITKKFVDARSHEHKIRGNFILFPQNMPHITQVNLIIQLLQY